MTISMPPAQLSSQVIQQPGLVTAGRYLLIDYLPRHMPLVKSIEEGFQLLELLLARYSAPYWILLSFVRVDAAHEARQMG